MTEELGMYAMPDMKPGIVKIGEYTLCRQSEGKIWIQHDDAEGGEFTESLLAEVIEKFYKEHF